MSADENEGPGPRRPVHPAEPSNDLERIADLERRLAESEARLERAEGELVLERQRSELGEKRFFAFAEMVPHIIWAARPDGSLDYFSQRSLEYAGMQHEDLKDWSWPRVLHPDDVPQTIERWTHALTTGEIYEAEFRIRRASDQSYRWHLVRALPERDASGRILRWFGSCTDVHDQKMGEEALVAEHHDLEVRVAARTEELARANERLAIELAEREFAELAATAERNLSERMVNSLPGIFYVFDTEGRFLRWNKNFESVSGYSTEEVERLRPLDLFRGADKELIESRIRRCFETGEAEADAYLVPKTEQAIPYYFTGRLIHIDGQPCIIGMGIDASARRFAEEERDRLFRLSRDLFCIAGFDGYFKQINPAWEATLGHRPEALLGRPFLEFVHPDDRATTRARFESFEKGEDLATFENRYRAADGTYHWLSWSSHAVVELGLVYSVARDVTRQKHLEEHVRQVQKLDSIGQLAAGVAHDFNNLLTVQQAYLALVLSDPRLPGTLGASLQQVVLASERAATLTRQLLSFSRRQILQTEALDLHEVVANLGKMLKRILGEDVALEIEKSQETLSVKADAGMIEQVLMNLAVNARDAMPRGGRLHVSLGISSRRVVEKSSHERDDPPDTVTQSFVRLSVTDTGTGIPEAIRERIFEPFFTTKEIGKGTGLGLSTVYGIVKQHDGFIDVESTENVGTTFHIYLPRALGTLRPPKSAEMEVRAHHRGHETILVVEDEEPLRKVVEEILSERGYRVLSAQNGAEAITLWQAHRHGIDLLLTDMIMPGGLSGREVVQRLRADEPRLPVILTSGYSNELFDRDAFADVAFLQKPYLPRALERLVRDVLGRHGAESGRRGSAPPVEREETG